MNRALINQNQALVLRGGIPEDAIPRHVSGGIPVQRYLQGLLDRMPQVPLDPAFELVSRETIRDENNSAATSRDLNDFSNDSVAFRNAFVDDLRAWIDQHVRVKVNIAGAEHSCYVWQSVLEPDSNANTTASSSAPRSGEDDSDDLDPLERNVLEPRSDSSSDSEPALHVAPAAMFHRYVTGVSCLYFGLDCFILITIVNKSNFSFKFYFFLLQVSLHN